MAHDIFLSYRNEDKGSAERLCEGLESQGITCWIAPRNIPVGTEWPTAIVEAIGACKIFVLLLSSHSQNAKQISREAELADRQGCRIITFRVEDVEPPASLNYFLGNIQWLDAFGGQFDRAMAQLVGVVKKAPETEIKALREDGAIPLRAATSPEGLDSSRRIESSSKPMLWIGLAALLTVIVALAVWLGVRRSSSAPGSQETQSGPVPHAEINVKDLPEAKAVAERFLNERETGNVDAAWAELTNAFQNNVDQSKWRRAQAELQQHGHVTNTLKGCTLAGNAFLCEYSLAHADGTVQQNKIWLIKNRQGGWSIARSELRTASNR